MSAEKIEIREKIILVSSRGRPIQSSGDLRVCFQTSICRFFWSEKAIWCFTLRYCKYNWRITERQVKPGQIKERVKCFMNWEFESHSNRLILSRSVKTEFIFNSVFNFKSVTAWNLILNIKNFLFWKQTSRKTSLRFWSQTYKHNLNVTLYLNTCITD